MARHPDAYPTRSQVSAEFRGRKTDPPSVQRQQQRRKGPLTNQLSMFGELLAPGAVASLAIDTVLPALLEELRHHAFVADYRWPGVPAVAVDEPEFAGLGADLG